MQVGLKTTTAHTAPALQRGGVDAAHSPERSATVPAVPSSRNVFPEAALLSRRPMRYNVQLNQQLTSVQQADDYLAQTETRLLQLRQTAGQAEATRYTGALQKHLERREQLSGGTIDRHLNVSLQHKNSVNFTLPGSEAIINNPGGETLLFALGGRERQLAAVSLPEEASARQILTRLNTGLGRLGINARQTPNGGVTFSVAESGWERVSQQLSVRGEGHNFPADAFTLLAPRAEAASNDELLQMARQHEPVSAAAVQKTLNHITTQRSRLRQQQDRVAVRINEMATTYTPQQALETAKALSHTLGDSARRYATLATALGAQANVHPATVKNLLG